MTVKRLSRIEMAARVAQDIPDGSYVNLGIGMPSMVSNYVPAGREVIYHGENGILGIGPTPASGEEDPDLANASKDLVTLVPGGSYFHHTDSFMMMRGGHLDISVLGAFQVAENGDLANWATNDESFPPAVGGAMDLAVGAKRLFVVMSHTNRHGAPKVLKRCTFPLTAAGVADRVFTDLAVISVTDEGFVVREMVDGLHKDELQELTEAPLTFAPDLRVLEPAVA